MKVDALNVIDFMYYKKQDLGLNNEEIEKLYHKQLFLFDAAAIITKYAEENGCNTMKCIVETENIDRLVLNVKSLAEIYKN